MYNIFFFKVEARRRKELEQDEIRMKELEEMKSVAKAEANMKVMIGNILIFALKHKGKPGYMLCSFLPFFCLKDKMEKVH